MSKKSRLIFNLKRGIAEIGNALYYITVVPFLIHNFYKWCRSFFSSPNRLKSSNRFQMVDDRDQNFDIQESGNAKNKKILKKTPLLGELPEKNKFNAHWFAKLQQPNHAIREIVTEGVFRLLSGEKHAAKVRLMKDEETGDIYSISKLFKNAKTFFSLWQHEQEHSKKAQLYDFYLKMTENLEGFEEMLFITLLLGRDDCHMANWAIIPEYEKRFSVTFDYGHAMENPPRVSIIDLLARHSHSYERIVCEKFLSACKKILKKFEKNHDEIIEELLKGIEAAEAVFDWWKVPTANDVMRIFTNNKRQLEHLYYHIRAEIAVSQNNPEKFEKYIKKANPAYNFPVLSTQRRDFKLPNYPSKVDNEARLFHKDDFNTFINEGYIQVFTCYSKLALKKFQQNALYLLKTDRGIEVYRGGESYRINEIDFNQEQAEAMENLVEFPENKDELFECTVELSKKIISIFACPLEKSPKIRNQLNSVCQKYAIK